MAYYKPALLTRSAKRWLTGSSFVFRMTSGVFRLSDRGYRLSDPVFALATTAPFQT